MNCGGIDVASSLDFNEVERTQTSGTIVIKRYVNSNMYIIYFHIYLIFYYYLFLPANTLRYTNATAIFIIISNIPTAAPSEKNPNSKACLYMYKDIVVVEDKGPPLVIINCKSKKLIVQTVTNIKFVKINGFKSGRVM